MAKIRVNLNLDEELNRRWNDVSKRIKMSKSAMLTEYLEQVLPILEKEEPRDILGSAFRQLAKSMNEIGEVIDENNKK